MQKKFKVLWTSVFQNTLGPMPTVAQAKARFEPNLESYYPYVQHTTEIGGFGRSIAYKTGPVEASKGDWID